MNKIKFLVVLSVLAISSLGFTPAFAQTTQERIVAYAEPYEFTEYSIYTQDSYATAQWTSAIYAGLFRRSAEADRAYVPDIAASMPTTSDGLTWTIDIRTDAKFSTGNPVTVDDIIFSFKVAVNPSINTAGYSSASQFLDNSSAVKVDADTLTVTLTQNYAFPLGMLSQPIIEAAVFQARYDSCNAGTASDCVWDATDGSDAQSAGPFMMDSIDTVNNVVSLVKNPYYYGEVLSDRIIYIQYSEFAGAKAALAAGDVHIVDSQYFAGLTAYDDITSGVVTQKVGDPATQEISLNHLSPYYGTGLGTPLGQSDAAQAPMAALYVRRAMSAIANRELYANQFLEGLGSPAASTMPSAAVGWDPTLEPDTFNITRAKELMTMAGYDYSTLTDSNGDGAYETFFFSITVLAPNTNGARNQWSAHWKDQLAYIGIGVNSYENVGWDIIVPRTFGYENTSAPQGAQYPVPLWDDGGYDVLFVGYGWGLDWDPTGLFENTSFLPTGGNFYNYVNLTTQGLIQDYLTEIDPTARIAKVKLVQKALHDDLPVIPLVYPESLWAFSDQISGIDALLLSTSSQEWDKVIGVLGTPVTTTTTATTTATTVSTVTNVTTSVTTSVATSVETSVSVSTVTGTPFDSIAIFMAMFFSGFVAVVLRRKRN